MLLGLLLTLPAGAQQRKLKLDSLGLPPYPGANNIGHISLPLKDILKPKPGEHPTGPALTDLAIQTYRTPLTTSVDTICTFYLKYSQQLGWKLLDDIVDGPQNRSLVLWSPQAPGYLTIEVLPGPENTRQIDLTRLLGDVNPSRPGEVVKLTGKRIREQKVSISYAGQWEDLKTGKMVRQTLSAVEERMESGLPPTSALRAAQIDQSYLAVVKVNDSTKHMTSADAYTSNNTLVAHGESKTPTGSLTMLAKLRATQGLTLRVVINGVLDLPKPPVAPKPAALPVKPAGAKPAPAAKKPAVKGKAEPVTKAAPKPSVPAAPVAVPAVPTPPPPPMVLSEVYGLRPPLTAVPEVRRGIATTKSETITLEKDVEIGPTCDERKTQALPWTAVATDQFSFSPDLFGATLQRGAIGTKTGTQTVEFPQGSGQSNTYTLTQTKTTTTTEVLLGYAYNGQWVPLPAKKVNPTRTSYVLTTAGQPIATKKSSGACPPKQ